MKPEITTLVDTSQLNELIAENVAQKMFISDLVEGLKRLIPFMYPDERTIAVEKAKTLIILAKKYQ